MTIILEAIALVCGLYTLGVALMLIGGLLLCPAAVKLLADEMGTSFATTLLLGAVFWPIMVGKPWKGPLL